MSVAPPQWLAGIGFVLLLIVGIYTALLLVLFFSQSRLLYLPDLPSRDVDATPADLGLAYEPVAIRTDDGVTLDGWFLPHARPRGVLLFFHGNAGNISHRLESLQIFHDLGLAVLIFDYRGYGRSEGKPSEGGTYRDAEAAWRYLTETRHVAPEETVFFGRSLGAAVAAYLAARHPPGALILESAFTSVPDFAAEFYPLFPVRWLARFRYHTAEYVKSLARPILVVHSRDDEIIPFTHGRRVFASANQPKQFLELKGGHNDGFYVSGRVYRDGLDDFLSMYFGGQVRADNSRKSISPQRRKDAKKEN